MLTPFSLKLVPGDDQFYTMEAVTYGSDEALIKEGDYPWNEKYTVYGLLHIPEKELLFRFKEYYFRGMYVTKSDVYSGAEKIKQVFEELEPHLKQTLKIKISCSTVRWMEHFLKHKDNESQVYYLCRFPFFHVRRYLGDRYELRRQLEQIKKGLPTKPESSCHQ